MCAGAYIASADAWEINVWIIDVVAEVGARKGCGSVVTCNVTCDAGRHI